jgi:predicted acetyltransferase
MAISIRDARNSPVDRRYIQEAFGEYLDDLTRVSMNTGIFPAFGNFGGDFGDRQPDMMARWFADDSSHPLVILRDEKQVGFALVARPMMKRPDGADHRLAEFFVSKDVRRLGVGRQAAELIFNRFSGGWEITEMTRNQGAVAFWRDVVGAYTHGDFRESVASGEMRHFFKSQAPMAQRRAR